MTRKTTWTNADGLVVGFGPNYPERQDSGLVKTEGAEKQAVLDFTYESTLGASGAKISLPAGSVVKSVFMKVGNAWTGGTSLTLGDATDPNGWITAVQAATANLTAGALIRAGGAYAVVPIATTPPVNERQLEKVYATATDLYITGAGTFTAGSAKIVVEYV